MAKKKTATVTPKRKRTGCTVLTEDLTSTFATGSERGCDRGIDLVSVDFFRPCALDSLVEPLEQLRQLLARSALQHGQSVGAVGSYCHTSHRVEDADGDFSIGDELCDVRQTNIARIGYSDIVL